MVRVVSEIIRADENSALLLADIGVWAFRDLLHDIPARARNIGIFEPATVSLAAGLSLMGIVPTIYGISPFLVQRALEQLKLDFVYQKAPGNFITTGASYDFSTLGYSHYCPEDVATLKQLPGMEIFTPGTPDQFETLYRYAHKNDRISYFRMTDHCNQTQIPTEYGKASVLKRGKKAVVVAAAEMLDIALTACQGLDVSLLYYTTLAPFDYRTLREECAGGKVLLCTPFYCGTLCHDIMTALDSVPVRILEAGVPNEVLRSYGVKQEKDRYCGLYPEAVRAKLVQLIT